MTALDCLILALYFGLVHWFGLPLSALTLFLLCVVLFLIRIPAATWPWQRP